MEGFYGHIIQEGKFKEGWKKYKENLKKQFVVPDYSKQKKEESSITITKDMIKAQYDIITKNIKRWVNEVNKNQDFKKEVTEKLKKYEKQAKEDGDYESFKDDMFNYKFVPIKCKIETSDTTEIEVNLVPGGDQMYNCVITAACEDIFNTLIKNTEGIDTRLFDINFGDGDEGCLWFEFKKPNA